MDTETTKGDGTTPTLGITIREAGVGTREVVTVAVVMAAGAGVTRTLATITNRATAGVRLGAISSMAITALSPTA